MRLCFHLCRLTTAYRVTFSETPGTIPSLFLFLFVTPYFHSLLHLIPFPACLWAVKAALYCVWRLAKTGQESKSRSVRRKGGWRGWGGEKGYSEWGSRDKNRERGEEWLRHTPQQWKPEQTAFFKRSSLSLVWLRQGAGQRHTVNMKTHTHALTHSIDFHWRRASRPLPLWVYDWVSCANRTSFLFGMFALNWDLF